MELWLHMDRRLMRDLGPRADVLGSRGLIIVYVTLSSCALPSDHMWEASRKPSGKNKLGRKIWLPFRQIAC